MTLKDLLEDDWKKDLELAHPGGTFVPKFCTDGVYHGLNEKGAYISWSCLKEGFEILKANKKVILYRYTYYYSYPAGVVVIEETLFSTRAFNYYSANKDNLIKTDTKTITLKEQGCNKKSSLMVDYLS